FYVGYLVISRASSVISYGLICQTSIPLTIPLFFLHHTLHQRSLTHSEGRYYQHLYDRAGMNGSGRSSDREALCSLRSVRNRYPHPQVGRAAFLDRAPHFSPSSTARGCSVCCSRPLNG